MQEHSPHHLLHFIGNRELNELYLSIAIRAFAISLIGIFVPIYLYQVGYSLQQIFFYYAAYSFFHAVLTIPSAKIGARFGLKHTIFFSMPFLIVFFLLLYSLEQFKWPLPFVAFILGISMSLFWVSYHIDFSKFSDRKNRGKEVGFSKILATIFSIIGPFLGGVILALIGFKILFLIVSLLLLCSVVPLFFSDEIHEPVKFSLKGFIKKTKLKNALAFAGHGIEFGIGFILWPLFIFLFILGEKYMSLGLVHSLISLFSLIIILAIGKYSDIYRKALLKIGTVFNALVWIAKSFIITPIQVFIIDSLYGASQATMNIPFDAINYDKASKRKQSITRIIASREIYHHLGRTIFFIVLILTIEVITDLIPVFRYGGPASSLLRWFF